MWKILGIVALTLMTALASANDDPLVARINGHEIRVSDVLREVESLSLGDQIDVQANLAKFTESVVQEEILFHSVVTVFHGDAALRRRVKDNIVNHLIQTEVSAKIGASDAVIEQYYRDNASAIRGEHVDARQIVLKERSQCESLAEVLQDEDAFSAYASAHSLEPQSAARGGDIGSFMNHAGGLGFETAMFDMQVGEMRVFDRNEMCHLVLVTNRVTPPMPPLAEVRDRIKRLIEREQEIELLRALIEERSKRVSIERFE